MADIGRERKKAIEMNAIDEPFGPPPQHYNYRCSVCKTEIEVNEAVIDAEIGMAKFNNEYYYSGN